MATGCIAKGETKLKILEALIGLGILEWDEGGEPEPAENVESQFRIYARYNYHTKKGADIIATDLSTGETRFLKAIQFDW